MSVTAIECAVLAMDAYNRNYGQPLDLDPGSLLEQSVTLEGQMAVPESSFYAAAYDVGSTIVIAFRGTDSVLAGC